MCDVVEAAHHVQGGFRVAIAAQGGGEQPAYRLSEGVSPGAALGVVDGARAGVVSAHDGLTLPASPPFPPSRSRRERRATLTDQPGPPDDPPSQGERGSWCERDEPGI